MDPGFDKGDARNLPKISTASMFTFISRNSNYIHSETRGVKMARVGREEYGDDAIGYVQVKRDKNECIVRARICPEHKVRSKAYVVEARLLEESGESEVVTLSCKDCTASLGGCKHSHALLTWLHRRSEEKPCTSVACYWKKPKLATVGALVRTAADLSCSSKKKEYGGYEGDSTDSFFAEVLEAAKHNSVTSQLMQHYLPQTLPKQISMHLLIRDFKDMGGGSADEFLLFCREKLSTLSLQDVATLTADQSHSPSWFHVRYGRWSGSSAHECAHCTTEEGSLVERILGARHAVTRQMERGLNLEEEVLQVVARKLGYHIKRSGFILSKDVPEGGCSPDGISEDAIFEVKCPSKVSSRDNYVGINNILKSKVYAQMQMEMWFTGKEEGYLCLASPSFEIDKDVEIIKVEFDSNFSISLISKCTQFWSNYIFPILYN